MGQALALLFTFGWIPIFAFRAETWHVTLPLYARGERFWIVVTPIVIAAHVTLGCLATSAESAMPVWRAVASAVVFVAGVLIWLWGRIAVGPLLRRRVPSESPSEFRRDGAFGLVRHPMYFGHLLASLAPVVAAPRPLLLMTLAACAVSLSMIAIQEERRLHRQLGPVYEQYSREVKRLIPFVW
jgi:protein-S-isoprenylcysteine O-methyltransferase Ste14